MFSYLLPHMIKLSTNKSIYMTSFLNILESSIIIIVIIIVSIPTSMMQNFHIQASS